MNKNWLRSAALAALFFGNAAYAADIPAPVYKAAPVSVALYNWSGFYIGGHAGGGWGHPTFTNLVNTSTFGGALPGQSFTQSSSGFIGGGQIGYNWQVSNWVWGLEASFAGSTIKGSSTNFVDDQFTNKLRDLLLVSGRLGYASNNWLFYGKGGYAGASRRASVLDNGIVSPGVGSGSASAWHNGWNVGAGIEYGLTAHWILGVQYDYVNLSAQNYQLDGTDGGGLSYLFAIKANYQLVTGRASYKF